MYVYVRACDYRMSPGSLYNCKYLSTGAHYAIYVVAGSSKDHYLPHESPNSAAILLHGDYFQARQCGTRYFIGTGTDTVSSQFLCELLAAVRSI